MQFGQQLPRVGAIIVPQSGHRKDQLRELHKDWGKSPMPSYRGVLSDQEMQDVIAYLISLQGAP